MTNLGAKTVIHSKEMAGIDYKGFCDCRLLYIHVHYARIFWSILVRRILKRHLILLEICYIQAYR